MLIYNKEFLTAMKTSHITFDAYNQCTPRLAVQGAPAPANVIDNFLIVYISVLQIEVLHFLFIDLIIQWIHCTIIDSRLFSSASAQRTALQVHGTLLFNCLRRRQQASRKLSPALMGTTSTIQLSGGDALRQVKWSSSVTWNLTNFN